MRIAFVVAVVTWLGLLLAEFSAANRLRAYRKDIGEHQPPWRGASLIPQVNVSSRENYTAEGQQKLRWLKALGVARAAAMAISVALFVAAFVL